MTEFEKEYGGMSEEEYQHTDKKFGKLMFRISYMITGDGSVCSFEDNLQDLWISAMDALVGFKRQNDGVNGSFNDFKDSSAWASYLKTVLWNKKNKKGVKATKFKEAFKGSVSIQEHGEVLNIAKDTSPDNPLKSFQDRYFHNLNEEESKALDLIVNNPRMITRSGKVDCAKLSRGMDTYWDKARLIVDSLKNKMENK